MTSKNNHNRNPVDDAVNALPVISIVVFLILLFINIYCVGPWDHLSTQDTHNPRIFVVAWLCLFAVEMAASILFAIMSRSSVGERGFYSVIAEIILYILTFLAIVLSVVNFWIYIVTLSVI